MNDDKVVLDRGGLLRLGGGVSLLLVLVFTAGTVVGFALGGGTAGVPAGGISAPAGLSVASTGPILPPPRPAPEVEPDPSGPRPSAGDAPGAEATEVVAEAAPRFVDRSDPAADAGYAVQVGVFGVEANAERLVAQLRSRGYDPLVTALRNRSGHWMQRVQLSTYPTERAASAAADTFRVREGMPAVVVAWGGGGE